MSYNGWTNYETRTVKLWMDNEESSYRYWGAVANEAWEEANPLADQVSTWSDLLGAALSAVNWSEIANSLLEDGDYEGYESVTFAHTE